MMTTLRREKHLQHFTEYELAELAPALTRLDKPLESFTRKELQQLLSIVYSLPHEDRSDQRRCLMAPMIAGQVLSTFQRYEIDHHATDPAFCAEVLRLIDTISRTLEDIRSRAKKGAV
jgi:hypothetical protein